MSNSGRDAYLSKLSPVSSSLESYQKFNKILEDVAHVKVETSKRMSEENRVSILKALSQYANKLYTSLGIYCFTNTFYLRINFLCFP